MKFSDRPSCSVKEACEATGLGETTLYELMKGKPPQVESVLFHGRRLIKVPSLLRLLDEDFEPVKKNPPVRRGPRRGTRGPRPFHGGEPPDAA